MLKKLAVVFFVLTSAIAIQAQDKDQQPDPITQKIAALHWEQGGSGAKGSIGSIASVAIPSDHGFLADSDTSKFLQLAGNPPRKDHYLIAPKTLAWFAIFNFDESGYVKDDEKINASELLSTIKDSDEAGNKERKRLGLPTIYTEGWAVEPHYEPSTKRLEWGLRLRDEQGQYVVNYTTRLLGRTGVMEATLVTDPESLTKDVAEFRKVLTGFDYNGGYRYSEFKQGDKVAAYGLAALVLGGAAAVATKKGFWAVLGGFFAAGWKFIIAALVAMGAGIGKLFKRGKSAE